MDEKNVKEMFTKILDRLDKTKEARKKEYEILTEEIKSIKNEMQTALGIV